MIRDEIRTMIERTSLSEVLDAVAGVIFDLADESVQITAQNTLEGIGRIISKQASKATRAKL